MPAANVPTPTILEAAAVHFLFEPKRLEFLVAAAQAFASPQLNVYSELGNFVLNAPVPEQ